MLIKDLSIELDAKAMTEVAGGATATATSDQTGQNYVGGNVMLTSQEGLANNSFNIVANSQSLNQEALVSAQAKDFKKSVHIDPVTTILSF
jgi:hypothetical protein